MNPSSSERRPWTSSPGSGSAATIRTPGLSLAEIARDAHQRPARAEAGDEHVDLGAVGEDLRAGRLVVGQRVGRVAVLVRHHEALVLADQVLGQRDRPVRARRPRGVDDLGAEQRGHLAPLVGDVVGHDQRDAVALAPADHRQRDAGVARGRLEDDRVLVQAAARLEVLDQVLGDAILDRAGRVEHLELGEDAHVGVRRHARDLDQRRVADRLEDVAVAAAVRDQRLVGVRVRVLVFGLDRAAEGRPSVSRRPSPAGGGPRRPGRPACRGPRGSGRPGR